VHIGLLFLFFLAIQVHTKPIKLSFEKLGELNLSLREMNKSLQALGLKIPSNVYVIKLPDRGIMEGISAKKHRKTPKKLKYLNTYPNFVLKKLDIYPDFVLKMSDIYPNFVN
jgi:hypothetical protein